MTRHVDRDAPLSGGWEQVAAGCHVGTSIEPRERLGTSSADVAEVYVPGGRQIAKAQENRPPGGSAWTPLPSAPGGISVALHSSSAAVRRGPGFRALREVTMQDSDTVALENSSHHRDSEQHAEREQTNELAADGGEDALDLGTRVVDRDDIAGERNPAVVTALPDEPAYAHTLDELDGEPSVADLNPAYGASGMVATVAFLDDLNKHVPDWRDRDVEELAGVVETTEALTGYTYPIERLRHAPPGDDAQGGDER